MKQANEELIAALEVVRGLLKADDIIVISVTEKDENTLDSAVVSSISNQDTISEIMLQLAMQSQIENSNGNLGVISFADGDFSFEKFYDALPQEAQTEIDGLTTEKRGEIQSLMNSFGAMLVQPESETKQ